MARRVLTLKLVAVMVLIILPFSAAIADEQYDAEKLMEDVVTIVAKGPDYVRLWETNFSISYSTKILARDGSLLTLEKIVVPCRARIKYYSPKGGENPVVTEIRLLRDPKPR